MLLVDICVNTLFLLHHLWTYYFWTQLIEHILSLHHYLTKIYNLQKTGTPDPLRVGTANSRSIS